MVAAAPIALLCISVGCGLHPKDTRPNVVLITIDTLRADRVGVYGGSVDTPTLDRLAKEGIRFEAAASTVPLTLPAHVSMLSGRLPVAHTVRTNDGFDVPREVVLVSESLKEAGYETAAFVGASVLRSETGIGRGFDLFDDDVGSRGERRGEAVADRTVAWLQRTPQQPFFLWVHFYDPHAEYDPPEPYRSRYIGRPYDGEVAYADAQLGRILQSLRELELLGRSAIIVAGDHGESLGDHGERSHGALLYESALHVPLIVRLPGAERAGLVVPTPVSVASIASTILDLAQQSERMPETSLLAGAISESSAGQKPVIAESLYLKLLLGWTALYSVRVGRYKLIEAPEVELYDLEVDPAESHNLASKRPEKTRELTELLQRDLHSVASTAPSAVSPDVGRADLEALAALGYVSIGTMPQQAVEPVGGPDVRSRMPLWEKIESGLAFSKRGNHQAATRVFQEVLRDDPDDVVALRFLGARALETGDLESAVDLNERVVRTGLHVADALSNLALAYYRLGRTNDALAAVERALAASPRHVAAHYNRALILAGAGRTGEAAKEVQEVLRLDPAHAQARSLGDRLAEGSSAPTADLDEARALMAAGDFGRACEVLQEAVESHGGDPDLYDLLGIALVRTGNRRGARDAFLRAIALAPDRLDSHERLGALLHEEGDRQGARAQFEVVLRADPKRRPARFSLGLLELEERRFEEARDLLEPIVSGWEGAVRARLYLGDAYWGMGDLTSAREAYEACLRQAEEGDPAKEEARQRLEALR
jgi:choline-sulfatase